MRYTLWSRGRVVGYTDLDVHTVTPTMRQGFIEPTAEGKPLLADATAVWRAMAEVKRDMRARGVARSNDRRLVQEAIQRREGLDFELRAEDGTLFECEFIRISDIFDFDSGVVDEMCDTEEEEEAEFQIMLSGLAGDARDEALEQRAEMSAEVDAMFAEIREEQNERDMFGSWPPAPPEDPRWETMQYLMQVHLKSNDWE